jgi:glycine cleavage system aminomethyltransferase T
MTDVPRSTTLNFGPWYRRSPFFEATLRAGCSAYDVYQHMYHPNTYGDPIEEYWSLINDVTLWDVSVERIVEITGPDATAFTNSLTCRDLTTCQVKQGKYMLVTAPDGGIVNDPVLLRIEENRWWLALADSDAGLYAMGVAVNSGMDVHVGHPEVYPVQVQGPKAKDVMRDMFGDRILDMKYYWCDEAELDGIPVVISRTGWTAVVGYEIYLREPERGDDLWERILDAGEPYGIRVTPSSDPRRIEAGIFDWGSDFGLETNPFEVTGLERLVGSTASRASWWASSSRATPSSSRPGTGRRLQTARRSATSPTRPGHRAWRRTSATCGCRSGSRTPVTASRSRPTTGCGSASRPSCRSSIPRRGCRPPDPHRCGIRGRVHPCVVLARQGGHVAHHRSLDGSLIEPPQRSGLLASHMRSPHAVSRRGLGNA